MDMMKVVCYTALVLLLWPTEYSLAQIEECDSERNMRLVGGTTELEGRVELCRTAGGSGAHSLQWSAICYRNVTDTTAKVICSSLGYSQQGFTVEEDTGGSYNLSFEFNCTTILVHCNIKNAKNSCRSARIKCQPKMCQDWDVRLVGGGSAMEGRVEVCKDEQWEAVPTCANRWGSRDANVVCRQLGYSRYDATAIDGLTFGESFAGFQYYIDCEVDSPRLVECTRKELEDCSDSNVGIAGVKCEEKCNFCSTQTTESPTTPDDNELNYSSSEIGLGVLSALLILTLAGITGALVYSVIINVQQKQRIKQLQKLFKQTKAGEGNYPEHTFNNPVYGAPEGLQPPAKASQYSEVGPELYEIIDPEDVKAPTIAANSYTK